MSRRGVIALVVAASSLTALVLGLVFGLRVARLDEGAVIAAYAARYAAETGGDPSDCVARPGTGEVWLRIRCSGAAEHVYLISRWGFRLDGAGRNGI